MRVPEVMKSNAGQIVRLCQDTDELMSQAVRLQGTRVLFSDDVCLIGHPDSHSQKFLSLMNAVSPQFLHDQGRESHSPGPAALRFLAWHRLRASCATAGDAWDCATRPHARRYKPLRIGGAFPCGVIVIRLSTAAAIDTIRAVSGPPSRLPSRARHWRPCCQRSIPSVARLAYRRVR
jgi:hypothetical protein